MEHFISQLAVRASDSHELANNPAQHVQCFHRLSYNTQTMHRMLHQKNKLTAHKAQAHSVTAIHDALIVPQINTAESGHLGCKKQCYMQHNQGMRE